MEDNDVGTEGFLWAMQKLVTLFYKVNGLIASPRPDRFQEDLDVISGTFYLVGLRTNVDKTVVMVFEPCCTSGR